MTDDELNALAMRLGDRLRRDGLRIATAESCTGGWIARVLTDIAGSSDYFECGFVTYSNAAKTTMLGIDSALIDEHGAVSQAVARSMAEQAVACSAADVALAVTGIAGPGGGSADKPVGTVWFAWSIGSVCVDQVMVFSGDRRAIRAAAVEHALRRCLDQLK